VRLAELGMPTIATLRGMAIRMYYRHEHPPPHFHVVYQRDGAFVSIETGEIIHGRLSPSRAQIIRRRTALHRQELLANWERGRRNEPFEKIAGLD
jgi:hypothetical protein